MFFVNNVDWDKFEFWVWVFDLNNIVAYSLCKYFCQSKAFWSGIKSILFKINIIFFSSFLLKIEDSISLLLVFKGSLESNTSKITS